MATVRLEKRKNGFYYVVIDSRSEGGGRETKSTKTKKKSEAMKFLGEYQHKVNTNTYLPYCKIPFTEFLKSWLDDYVSINCRESTKQCYTLCLNAHVMPWFEKLNLPLGKITPIVLQKYYNEKIKSGLSPNTVRKHHANIRKCLDYAKKMQLITFNPADNVELPKKKKYRAKFYTKDEVLKLLEIVTDTPIEAAVDYVSRNFKKLLEQYNMRMIRFHDLRHTNASLLLAQGVDLKRIQGWLGHAQLSTTADIYSHLTEDYKKINATIINNILTI